MLQSVHCLWCQLRVELRNVIGRLRKEHRVTVRKAAAGPGTAR